MLRLDTLGRLALYGADGREIRSVLAQPKRLALLVYLSAASDGDFQQRDHLFALFWPELSQAHARQALRQSLYVLRHALGDDVIATRGAQEVGIVRSAIECDACRFDASLAAGNLEEALASYRGDFLAGFYVAGASTELEQWIDATRSRLRVAAVDAAWRLARAAHGRGEAREAARWGRLATALDPSDERSLQRFIRLLDRQGDRAGALRAYAEFAQRLEVELDAEPSPETRALIAAVRRRTEERDAGAALADSAERPVAMAAGERAEPRQSSVASVATTTSGARPRRSAHRRVYLSAGVALPMLAAAAFVAWPTRHTHSPPVLAVGWVQDPAGADTSSEVRALGELLATDLARVPGLRVVSGARLHDLLGQRGVREQTPSTIADAARSAGATTVLEAVVARAPDRTLQLELRRVDLGTGAVSERRTVRAASVFALADSATATVAGTTDCTRPHARSRRSRRPRSRRSACTRKGCAASIRAIRRRRFLSSTRRCERIPPSRWRRTTPVSVRGRPTALRRDAISPALSRSATASPSASASSFVRRGPSSRTTRRSSRSPIRSSRATRRSREASSRSARRSSGAASTRRRCRISAARSRSTRSASPGGAHGAARATRSPRCSTITSASTRYRRPSAPHAGGRSCSHGRRARGGHSSRC